MGLSPENPGSDQQRAHLGTGKGILEGWQPTLRECPIQAFPQERTSHQGTAGNCNQSLAREKSELFENCPGGLRQMAGCAFKKAEGDRVSFLCRLINQRIKGSNLAFRQLAPVELVNHLLAGTDKEPGGNFLTD